MLIIGTFINIKKFQYNAIKERGIRVQTSPLTLYAYIYIPNT